MMKRLKAWLCSHGWHRWSKPIISVDSAKTDRFYAIKAKRCRWCFVLYIYDEITSEE